MPRGEVWELQGEEKSWRRWLGRKSAKGGVTRGRMLGRMSGRGWGAFPAPL